MDKFRIPSKERVILRDWDPDDRSLFSGDKEEAKELLGELNQQLEALQEMLYAQHLHKILIILQGMDTSGKDGTIRHVFEGVNPQGVRVTNFKVPTPIELDHDYLWRVHQKMPGKGEIMIFNRSHYEDVLVVRVHNLVPQNVWKKRFEQINSFEKMLFEEGTNIIKFYLHISKEEQKERLQARIDEPRKRWKFNPGDIKERGLWDDYIKAYEDVLSKTSTDHAPWYVVPANRKWYRNLVVATILIRELNNLKMSYPQVEQDYSEIVID